MQLTLIPWRVFLDALKEQSPRTREIWLRRWFFSDAGVIIAPPEIISRPSQAPSAAVAATR